MLQLTDEELLKYIKIGELQFYTLAEIHKILIQSNIKCNIEELRQKIFLLYRDGYIGNEPTGDGVNMYYIIFNPEEVTENITT
ncbi:hypothetical protein [Defluviitalea raffinosedens]|uniref:Uncharacterized protein n=1 Tax=Defluviitalea raffinosedens TaxID=1450156 RepID=A0A7C8HGJ1_9FIRM|nr:hypothetical protein [Defluviitalea raffinosedens]KAE9631217.1 hypothetical protein GND95_11860 [Defluviitalea raffinosedens]MBM7686245.1 hypothetical protein [Defluviitalea raffinosedens]MBZ4669031.1 hypothetical protein [Defluviitaleaceae bacterium]HHW68596.1 hypothetical protein [Candidatus Epulonipiscium sp.]